jgi:branched-chain amino acid aminotransferase
MNECFANWFIQNNKILSKEEFVLPAKFNFSVYEVIRIINGIPLFLEDHLQRLNDSLKLKGISKRIKFEELRDNLDDLIDINNIDFGNIRIALFSEKSNLNKFVYCVKHNYPSEDTYKRGVKLTSLNVVRNLPNAKIVHSDIKDKVDKILLNNEIYEVLLINNDGFVTEGSRSNIFFIKNNCLYTAPDDVVLKGITRKIIIQLAKFYAISLLQSPIKYSDLNSFESAFLCGTSPKVIPISEIDSLQFQVKNNLIRSIIEKYDRFIEEYITLNTHHNL